VIAMALRLVGCLTEPGIALLNRCRTCSPIFPPSKQRFNIYEASEGVPAGRKAMATPDRASQIKNILSLTAP